MKVLVRRDIVLQIIARKNLSQNNLAYKLRVSKGYVSQLLRGQRCPSPKVREKLQKLLGESFETLFQLESE